MICAVFTCWVPPAQFGTFMPSVCSQPAVWFGHILAHHQQAGRALIAFLKPLIEMLHVDHHKEKGDYGKFIELINAHMHTKTRVEVEKGGYFHVQLEGRDRYGIYMHARCTVAYHSPFLVEIYITYFFDV